MTQVCSGPAVFPQVSNITERGKNSPSTAVTQAKNNPFLVNQMMVSFPSQLQRSMCSFLCCLSSKCGEARRALGRGAGLTHGPGAAVELGAGQPMQRVTVPINPAHPNGDFLPASSSPVHEAVGREMPQTTELNTRLTGRLLPPREALVNPNFGDNEIVKER